MSANVAACGYPARPSASTQRRQDDRATRYGSRGHSRSPRPARCLRCVGTDAQHD